MTLTVGSQIFVLGGCGPNSWQSNICPCCQLIYTFSFHPFLFQSKPFYRWRNPWHAGLSWNLTIEIVPVESCQLDAFLLRDLFGVTGGHMFVQWPSRQKLFYILAYSLGHNICAVQRIIGPFQSALSASLQDSAIGYCPLTRSGSFCPWTDVGGKQERWETHCVTEIDQFSSPAPKRRQLQHKLEFLKRTISILQSTNTTTKIGRKRFLRRKTTRPPLTPWTYFLM